jgi:hypothetical protein
MMIRSALATAALLVAAAVDATPAIKSILARASYSMPATGRSSTSSVSAKARRLWSSMAAGAIGRPLGR